MKLFIIGNGFDIGHKLQTKYWHFRTYLENRYPDFLTAFEAHYDIYPNMSDNEKSNLLWNEFETNLANIDEDTIIEKGSSIEMALESGDVGIEDTLYDYFSEEFDYIKLLAKYLKQWVRTIKIRDVQKASTFITNNNFYVTFNYTALLETVYGVSLSKIIHIHGSLREYDIDPVLGHGNQERISVINKKRIEAENLFDEKSTSICKVVEGYYKTTFKDVNRYAMRLSNVSNFGYDEICVIGHSLAGVDMRYFKEIDLLTKSCLIWKVYYYNFDEKEKLKRNLISAGINENRIILVCATEFYNIKTC